MRINSIKTHTSFKASLSKNVAYALEKQGMDLFKRYGVNSKEFKDYQTNMSEIEKSLPDGEIFFEKNQKYSDTVYVKFPKQKSLVLSVSRYQLAATIAAQVKHPEHCMKCDI